MYIIQKTLYGCNYFLDKFNKWTGLRENALVMFPEDAGHKAKLLNYQLPYEQVTVKTIKQKK
jgi:hypothetical protein